MLEKQQIECIFILNIALQHQKSKLHSLNSFYPADSFTL